jgi:hypothetical protein
MKLNMKNLKKCINKHFIQTWEEGNGGSAYYYGPLLDPKLFKEYKIHQPKEIKHK